MWSATTNQPLPCTASGAIVKCSNPRRDGDRTLPDEAKQWPTPYGMGGLDATGKAAGAGGEFTQAVTHWQTPDASADKVTGKEGQPSLERDAQVWQTPRTADAHGVAYQRDKGVPEDERPSLTGQARSFPTSRQDQQTQDGETSSDGSPGSPRQWASPTQAATCGYTRDEGKRAAQGSKGHEGNQLLRQAEAMQDTGPMRLNPFFVEWLMGFPIGWTVCEPLVTPWCRARPRPLSSTFGGLRSGSDLG